MITRLKIIGYKCLREVDLRLTPLCVLVGPNDSGKTSLLEALTTLAATSTQPFDQVFTGGKSMTQVAWKGSEAPVIQWYLELGGIADSAGEPLRYALHVSRLPGVEVPKVSDEKLRCGNTLLLSSTNDGNVMNAENKKILSANPRAFSALCNLSHDGRLHEIPRAAEMHTSISSIQHFQLDPAELARPAPFLAGSTPTMDDRGFGLASLLSALKLADYPRFAQIEDGLREVIPSIQNVNIHSINLSDGRPGYSLAFSLAGSGWEVPAEHASAGVLLFLGYLTLVLTSKAHGTLLIEEPEAGIHPRRAREVVTLLRKLTEGVGGMKPTQVIVTTHSPYFVDCVRPKEVLIFRKTTDGSSKVWRMSDIPYINEWLTEQYLGELLFNVGEEALTEGTRPSPSEVAEQ